jgi:predicted nucleotidyltransferase
MLQKLSIVKTMDYFFTYPTKNHYLMDISKNINLAHTSVKRNLKQLIKEEIIIEEIEKKGSRKFPILKANINNKKYIQYKKIFNHFNLIHSGIIEHIEKVLTPNVVILFGSYQRGEDIEDSDIDLFIEAKEIELDTHYFEKKLKRKIQLHFKENFNAYPKELKNNIINGTIIYGFLEAYK